VQRNPTQRETQGAFGVESCFETRREGGERERRQFGAGLEERRRRRAGSDVVSLGDRYLTCKFIPSVARAAAAVLLPVAS
jgi:hypothetical protein